MSKIDPLERIAAAFERIADVLEKHAPVISGYFNSGVRHDTDTRFLSDAIKDAGSVIASAIDSK